MKRRLDEWDLKIAGIIPWGKGEALFYYGFLFFCRFCLFVGTVGIFWAVYRLVVK